MFLETPTLGLHSLVCSKDIHHLKNLLSEFQTENPFKEIVIGVTEKELLKEFDELSSDIIRFFYVPLSTSFSVTRNMAKTYIKSDWIIHIDPDERFSENFFAEIIARLSKDESGLFSAYAVPIRNYLNSDISNFYITFSPRVYKNDSKIVYQRRCHESILGSLKKHNMRISALNSHIDHYGYISNSTKELEEKFDYYWKLLWMEVKENPYCSEAWHNIAMYYANNKYRIPAIDILERAVSSDKYHYPTLKELFYQHLFRAVDISDMIIPLLEQSYAEKEQLKIIKAIKFMIDALVQESPVLLHKTSLDIPPDGKDALNKWKAI